jgi:hypothetical protein
VPDLRDLSDRSALKADPGASQEDQVQRERHMANVRAFATAPVSGMASFCVWV